MYGHCDNPSDSHKHWQAPANKGVQQVVRVLLEHGDCEHVVQVQSLDEHPHKHGSTCVLEEYITGFT